MNSFGKYSEEKNCVHIMLYIMPGINGQSTVLYCDNNYVVFIKYSNVDSKHLKKFKRLYFSIFLDLQIPCSNLIYIICL